MPNNNNNQANPKIAVGVAAALAAAAAGAYYFYGSKHSAKHRKQMKSWAIKARGEVVERLEKAKEISQDTYEKAVDQVMDKYKKVKNIDPVEITALTNDMRRHWKNIFSQVQGKPSKKTKSKK